MKKNKIKVVDKIKGRLALNKINKAKVLPSNSKELYRAIKKAGLNK